MLALQLSKITFTTMLKLTKCFKPIIICIALLFAIAPTKVHSCAFGCVKADVEGLNEVADALEKWADLLPRINEQFHEEVRSDLELMDKIAVNLLKQIDRTYKDNLDFTSSEVKELIQEAVRQIDNIGALAVDRYRELLWETECTADALGQKLTTSIKEIVPSFRWIREFFGESFNMLETTGFNGELIQVEFLADSATANRKAEFDLLELRLFSASDQTRMKDLLSVAHDMQQVAYKNHCGTRASIGQPKFGDFYNTWLRAIKVNRNLLSIHQLRIGR